MDTYECVNIGLTLVSLVGAGWSWWKANKSAEARNKAETAERNATMQAESVRRIADSLEKPPLVAGWETTDNFMIENVSSRQIVVKQVLNRDDFPNQIPGLQDGFMFNPGFRLYVDCEYSKYAVLRLEIAGRDDPLIVPL